MRVKHPTGKCLIVGKNCQSKKGNNSTKKIFRVTFLCQTVCPFDGENMFSVEILNGSRNVTKCQSVCKNDSEADLNLATTIPRLFLQKQSS